MKKLLAVISTLSLFATSGVWAAGINFNDTTAQALAGEKWQGGTDIYYTGGNVGIGESSPSAELVIKADTADGSDVFILKDSSDTTKYRVTDEGMLYIQERNGLVRGGVENTSMMNYTTVFPTGIQNTLVGYFAGRQINTGGQNTIMGSSAGAAISTGSGNTIMGASSNTGVNTSGNTAIGGYAQQGATGNNNTSVGYSAGRYVGVNSVNIGYGTGASGNTLGYPDYGINIGYNMGHYETNDNVLLIGSQAISTEEGHRRGAVLYGNMSLTTQNLTTNSEFTVHAQTANGSTAFMVKDDNDDVGFVVQDDGKTGIGTTTPTAQLHAQGGLDTALTGTVAVTLGTDAVTGTGTSFTTNVTVGDAIKIADEVFTVTYVTSNTSLTLDSNHVAGASGVTAYVDSDLFKVSTGDSVDKIVIDNTGTIKTREIEGITDGNLYINTELEDYRSGFEGTGSTFIGTTRPTGSVDNIIVIGGAHDNAYNVTRTFGTSDAIYINPAGNLSYDNEKQVIFGKGSTGESSSYQFYGDLPVDSGETVTLPGLSNVVTGTGTSFLTTFEVGQFFRIHTVIYKIDTINSDTELIITGSNPSVADENGTIKVGREYTFSVSKVPNTTSLVFGIDEMGYTRVVNGLKVGAEASPLEMLDVAGGVKLGTTTGTNAGTIRWDSTNFQGYNGSGWVNLDTQGSSGITIGDTVSSSTVGSILFVDGSNNLGQDNANLFWDDTNNELGIGTTTPDGKIHSVADADETLGVGVTTCSAGYAWTIDADLSGTLNQGDKCSKGALVVEGNILPEMTGATEDVPASGDFFVSTRTIGGPDNWFKALYVQDLHLGTNSLYMNGEQVLSNDSAQLEFKATSGQDMIISTIGEGGALSMQSQSGITTSIGATLAGKHLNLTNASANGNILLSATGTTSQVQLSAVDEIDLTATLIDVNGNMDVSGSFSLPALTLPEQGSNPGILDANGKLFTKDDTGTTKLYFMNDVGGVTDLITDTTVTTFTGLTDTPSSYTAGSVLFTSGSAVTEDNSNLFWDDTNNRLGIGVSAPENNLHVSTSIAGDGLSLSGTASPGLRLYNGDVVTSSIYYGQNILVLRNGDGASGTTLGDYLIVNQKNFNLHLGTNHLIRQTITGAGNVGIGVTDPDEKLEVAGRFHLGQTTAPTTTTDKLYNVSGDLYWNGLQLAMGSTGIANVVEDTTPQLGGMLDVNAFGLGDGTLELLNFTETASAVNEFTIVNAATGTAPALQATGDDTDIDLILTPKGTGGVGIGTTTPGGELVVVGEGLTNATYGLNVTDSGGTSNLFVRDDGKVGVGTTSPTNRLNIDLTGISGLPNTTDNDSSAYNADGVAGFKIESDNNALFMGLDNTTNSRVAWIQSGHENIAFAQYTGKLLLNPLGGDVGIGTTSPTEKLEVNGGIKLGTTIGTNAGTIRYDSGNFEGYNGTGWVALDVSGWSENTVSTKTAAYTATTSDYVILCDATTATFAVTLPTAVGNSGLELTIKKIDSSVNNCQVDPNGTETIDGVATTLAWSTQYQAYTIISDGTEWWIK